MAAYSSACRIVHLDFVLSSENTLATRVHCRLKSILILSSVMASTNVPIVFPAGLSGAAAPQQLGPCGPPAPQGMTSKPSQAAMPKSGQPQLFIPKMPYPSGMQESRHTQPEIRHGSASVGTASRGRDGSQSRGRDFQRERDRRRDETHSPVPSAARS